MADCGATGTTLDRTVQTLLGGGNGMQPQATAAAKAVLGHATQQQSYHHMGMPTVAPTELSLSRPSMPAAAKTSSTTNHHLTPPQSNGPMVSPGPVLQHAQQQQHHTASPYAPHMMHNSFAQHHHQQQQQQQLMMMQSMMQQQQQQLAQMTQQQQQQRQQSTTQPHKVESSAQEKVQPTSSSWENNLLDEQQLQAEIQHHLESIQHKKQTNNGEFERNYNEGFAQGASIEELASAWAEAEAEYAQEYAQDELYETVEHATNLAAAVQPTATTGTLPPYEFVNSVANQSQQHHEHISDMDWMQEGMRQFQAGNLPPAIRAFEMELQLSNENNAKAWRMLGRCHAENDQDREAILCLEHAVDRDPYSQEALLDLGVSYVNELNHEKALEALKSWITHNPNYAGLDLTQDLYGASKQGSQDHDPTHSASAAFEEVQRLLSRALEYDSTNESATDVLQALGVVYNVSRDYNAAVESLEKAVQINPNDYQLWNKLGATLANSNRSDQALPAYYKALQLKPKYARAWLNMAISHSNLNNYEEAARCYLQTLSLNPAAQHCWSYLRIALSCAERFDLIPLAAAQDLSGFQEHFDFVLYDNNNSNPSG